MESNLLENKAFIGGDWVAKEKTFVVDNPFDNSLIANVADCDKADAEQAVNAAYEAFALWSKESARNRSQLLLNWYQLIIEHKKELAELLTREQGKPLKEAEGEILYGASYVKWFAEEALRLNGDILPSPHSEKWVLIVKQPVGVVGIITPWNFPQAMIARKVAPALAVGCTVVIKPAAETPLSALAMAKLAQQAGIPDGVINIVPSTSAAEVGRVLTSNSKVRKISFTGSTGVGKILLKQAADNVQKTSMELGGNAPFIVFEDADIDAAVDGLIASKFRNSGQTCVCANRIFVHSAVHAEFVQKLQQKVSELTLGSGLDDGVQITALINQAAIEKVFGLIDSSVQAGAELIAGGRLSKASANIIEPTILDNVTVDMPIACEEIFGPVIGLIQFSNEDDVTQLANDTSAGLAAYVFTENRHRINRLSQRLEYGMIGFNEGVISNEMAPFGGVKQSGMGREGSKYGIDDYIELKYISIK